MTGEIDLTPTRDLAIYPTVFQVDPGQTRRIRITSNGSAPARELSYRIFIEEMPSAARAGAPAVQMLTRFGIPIFIQPPNPRASASMKMRVAQHKLSLSLDNTGNSYFVAESVEVVGRSRDGNVLFKETLPAWYVLAGGQRLFDIPLTKQVCANLVEITAHTTTDHGVVGAREAVPAGACDGS